MEVKDKCLQGEGRIDRVICYHILHIRLIFDFLPLPLSFFDLCSLLLFFLYLDMLPDEREPGMASGGSAVFVEVLWGKADFVVPVDGEWVDGEPFEIVQVF